MRLMMFPAAFMANTFAMMLVMIGLSLFGKPGLAADVGIIHGATVALFYAFSGSARSLILGEGGGIGSVEILRMRALLLLPLSFFAFLLCAGVIANSWLFAVLMILRRAVEWLAEVALSDHELQGDSKIATKFFAVQGVLSALLLLSLSTDGAWSIPILFVWAISPLHACMGGSSLVKRKPSCGLIYSFRSILPHLGSTAVIGVSVYLLRLFILLVTDKETAGDLFAAFAIGGILGAVFSQALGPTMVRQELAGNSKGTVMRLFNILLLLAVLLGTLLYFTVWFFPHLLTWGGKGQLFWSAVSMSLVGGVVMVFAQRIRLIIIQRATSRDVLGPDILANFVLIACVPLIFYSIGAEGLVGLYLISAILSLLFYFSEDRFTGEVVRNNYHHWSLCALVFLVFFPIFLQISQGVYQFKPGFVIDGQLSLLPIPLSVLACCAGVLLFGAYKFAKLSITIVALTFFGMFFSVLSLSLICGGEEKRKLILLVQFMLPMIALILGQQCGQYPRVVRAFPVLLLMVLLLIVPLQLIATLSYGSSKLVPSVFVFGVYQHLQYVPVILVSAFLICLFVCWGVARARLWILAISFLLGVYVVLSSSMLAMGFLVLGVLGFAVREGLVTRSWQWLAVIALVAVGFLIGYGFGNVKLILMKLGVGVGEGYVEGVPRNLQERMYYWDYYIGEVTRSVGVFLMGSSEVADRQQYPSAHNYYLDFIYNFGFVALLPIFYLIWCTIRLCVCNFQRIWASPLLSSLTGVVLFLLFADNGLKVGMRQPYPGIVTFFLWGLLIALLLKVKERSIGPVFESQGRA